MGKKIGLLLILLSFQNSLFAIWPTDGNQHVTGNFGTYEDGFHDAIDIPGVGGVTKCIAITNL